MSVSKVCQENEFGICEYIKKNYQDYRFGKPAEAVSLIIKDYDRLTSLTRDIDQVFLNINQHLNVAGDIFRPRMKMKVKSDIKKILNLQERLNTL